MDQITSNNHYVPQFYLKNWSDDGKSIWVYRKLVSNSKVPLWCQRAIKGTSKVEHLYTQGSENSRDDSVEEWLNNEVETPVQNTYKKIRESEELNDEDYDRLVRFVSVQVFRTPAHYLKTVDTRGRIIQEVIDRYTSNFDEEKFIRRVKRNRYRSVKEQDIFKMPIKTEIIEKNEDENLLRIDAYYGREAWLSEIRYAYNKYYNVLRKLKWSIIETNELSMPTSDDPVIRYNKTNSSVYQGGISQTGTHIIFPLTPHRVLYAIVGNRSLPRRFVLNKEESFVIYKMILDHGFLEVYSINWLRHMRENCPRTENLKDYERIYAMLENWDRHNLNMEAEYRDV